MEMIIYDRDFDLLIADFHGCSHQTARFASRQKIVECVSCGIRYCELVFGRKGSDVCDAVCDSIEERSTLIEEVWPIQQSADGELDFFNSDPYGRSRTVTGLICVLRCNIRDEDVSRCTSISGFEAEHTGEHAFGIPERAYCFGEAW